MSGVEAWNSGRYFVPLPAQTTSKPTSDALSTDDLAPALISGGFTFFTERIGRRAGFARNEANRLEIVDGRLTGRVLPPILGRAAKRSALARFAVQHRIGLEETLAVGDGANDRDMVEAAGLGVAFRAKPVLQRVAAASITHGDLTALLYLQGFCREEFVASSGVPATDVWP